ncbi:hypothetical protein [Gallionella capsiferriformans]|uniref:Uncharacterized protein n=1 Tax=Gallionella capsiferriformans (strain ES-2) TaxID=395494 RepID=D9SDG8_GALCS|nr:hypothetical protein [Gallionella capsiferriformans]ADL56766.1 hypothetical protein Galf_2771 [Gallionella capsiferriformans ES-2]
MKNLRQEKLRLMQRQYHRCNQWRLRMGGLYIPHSYSDTKPDGLSWWDDVGFILNGRRIIVWWQHPRLIYADAIDEQSLQEAGDSPQDNWLTDGSTKNYKPAGASRKKIVSYTSRQPSEAQSQYYDKLRIIGKRLANKGIEKDVAPSCKFERLNWAMGISLVAPMEVRNGNELAMVALLAKRLLLRQTTLEIEFPGYCYGRAEWLNEREKRAA